jgi:hypothetical protein
LDRWRDGNHAFGEDPEGDVGPRDEREEGLGGEAVREGFGCAEDDHVGKVVDRPC